MKNKTILITGGASGIGLAMVKKFAVEGSNIFFIDTNHLEGAKLQFEEHEKGYPVKFLEGSIANFSEVEKLIHSIPGKIDVLINNAVLLRCFHLDPQFFAMPSVGLVHQ